MPKKLLKSLKNVPIIPKNNNTNNTETQLNVWIPKDVNKKLEIMTAETEKTKKALVVEALIQYMS